MLGYLQGKIISKNTDTSTAVLLAGPVGYEIMFSKKTFEMITPQSDYSLWLHTHVREDAFILFGFLSELEKSFFRVLLGMSGLGPKTALSLLSEHGPERLCQLILEKKTSEISSAPGVGKKLAEKLVIELGSKVEKLQWVTQLEKFNQEVGSTVVAPSRQLRDDLNSALINLGYQQNHIKTALDRLFENKEAGFDFETGLRFVLAEISGRRNTTREAERAGNA